MKNLRQHLLTMVLAIVSLSLCAQEPSFSWEDTVETMIKNKLPDARYRDENIMLNDLTRLQLGLELQPGQQLDVDVVESSGGHGEWHTKLQLHIPLRSYDSRIFFQYLFIKSNASVSLRVVVDGTCEIRFENGHFTVKTWVKLTWQELRISSDIVPEYVLELIRQRVDSELRRLLAEQDQDLETKLNYSQDIVLFRESLSNDPQAVGRRFSIIGSWRGSSPFRPRHGNTGNAEMDSFVAAFIVRLLPDNRLQAVTDDYRLYALAQYILARYSVHSVKYNYFESDNGQWITVATNSDTLNAKIPRIDVIPTPVNGKYRMGGQLTNGNMLWLDLLKVIE